MMATKRRPRRKSCPYRGSRDKGPILYGLVLADSGRRLPDHGVLVGFCIPSNPPSRYRPTCGRDHEFALDASTERLG
jgi:hypothetical protein